jgi:hypothetical protein
LFLLCHHTDRLWVESFRVAMANVVQLVHKTGAKLRVLNLSVDVGDRYGGDPCVLFAILTPLVSQKKEDR